jgi:hypothetical protein
VLLRDKKVVSVFVRFSCAASKGMNVVGDLFGSGKNVLGGQIGSSDEKSSGYLCFY